MYCPNCGKKLEDGMAFCPECGRKVRVSAEQPLPGSSEIPVTKEEAQTLLEEILSSLSDEEREVIRLRYGGERTAAQIAEELGIPETEAQERLARAQKRSESKILEMEKRGTKLYSLAPLPFLAMLFKAYGVEASEGGAWQKERAESASEDTAKSSPESNAAKSAAERDAAGNAGAGADSTGAGAAEAGSGAGTAAESAGAQSAAAGAGAGTASGAGAAGAAGQAGAGAAAAGAAAGISAKTVAVIAVIAAACVGGGALALTQGGSSTAKTIEEQWQEQYDAGAQYLEEGEYEEAVSAFTEAIELIEEEEDAWIGRGTAYALLGDAGSAAADCEAVLSLEDLSAEDYIQTAEVYEILEDYEEALTVIEEGLLLYEEEETLLAKQEDITQLSLTQQFVDLYLDDLLAVAEMLWEDPESMGGTDWFGDDLRSFLYQIDEKIAVEVGEGMVLAAYSKGYVYYGNMEDGVRSGQGVWFNSYGSAGASALTEENYSVLVNYVYKGAWAEDYPNGYGEYYEFHLNMYLEMAMWEYAISFTDGYADGEGLFIVDSSEVTQNNVVGSCAIAFDYGEPTLIYSVYEDGAIEYALIEEEDGATHGWGLNEGMYICVPGAVKEADRTAAEDESEDGGDDEETGELVFDTSAQIEETVIYDAGNIRVTAERLEYTEETVDLVFLVENNADETVMLLNAGAGDGEPYLITVNGRYVFASDSLEFSYETQIPAGESAELPLSISREELKWSGITAIAEIETYLYLADELGRSLDNAEIELDLCTSAADTYDIEEEGLALNVLSEAGQKTYGYQILASSTEETVYDDGYGDQAVVSAAALIEENDGTFYFLIESEAYFYTRWYVTFYVNGILTDKTWDNTSGRYLDVEGDERCVLIFSLDPSECEEYGIDTVTSAKAVLSGTYGSDGMEEGSYVVELTTDR